MQCVSSYVPRHQSSIVIVIVRYHRCIARCSSIIPLFDILIYTALQCDRHAQNIFVDERGQIKLIDNEAALQVGTT